MVTEQQYAEFIIACKQSVSAVLIAITQDDPRFWLENRYIRWGAVEKAIIAGIERAAGALTIDDPYMPTPEEWAAHPTAGWAATDADGELRLYGRKATTRAASVIWHCNGTLLKRVAPPANFRDTLRQRPEGV